MDLCYPIVPISPTGVLVFGIIILVLVVLGGAMMFPSAPAAYVLRPAAALVLLLAAAFGLLLYRTYGSNVILDGESMSLNVPLYSRTVPYGMIDVEGVSIIDDPDNAALSLAIRTNGVGMPGYLLGSFRTSGGRRAFVALTDRSKIVYVPLTDGSTILLSVENAEDLVRRLGGLENGRNLRKECRSPEES